ncbi:DASH family cryptochrome [Photobacterium makurazakiensis]|uniref:DASH family cryptochrome n=1 Tax=Photobacterium makurazakiensis TaxID=2910234 RepID=UPI003D0CE643
MATGLFLFQNDLRLNDNPALSLAAAEVDRLICVFCMPNGRVNNYPYSISQYGKHRFQFLLQSLDDLSHKLEQHNQQLLVLLEHPLNILPELITRYNISSIYSSEHVGTYEQRNWLTLKGRYPYISFKQASTHTLFDQTELPFTLDSLPASFSTFRRLIENQPIESALDKVQKLPPPPPSFRAYDVISPMLNTINQSAFQGGETAGLKQLQAFFLTQKPSFYKETRNALDSWESSVKCSPWLALGCLSAKQIIQALEQYQQQATEPTSSSDWIKHDLLWREYFQWYAHKYGCQLFQFKGINESAPHTAFYPERFKRWCEGNTPYPLVNALMNQLKHTGYMPNCGREIVASCLTNELSLDWRYGASYFEEHLIDYDIAINWGGWQYFAGVSTNAQSPPHYDIEQQSSLYDPNGIFIKKWKGDKHDGGLDSVDAADWPIW